MAASSASATKSLFDLVCGCCLGSRRRGTHSHHDGERAPLLSSSSTRNQEALSSSSRLGSAFGGQTSAQGQGRQANRGKGGEDGRDGQLSPESVARKREEKRKFDAIRFKHVRESAKNALFTLDDSQLLPSSASTSTPAFASRASLPPKKDAPKDPQRASLIAASDSAERLYRAALSSPQGQSSKQAPSSPVGLVRHLHLSVNESARAAAAATAAAAAAEEEDGDDLGDVMGIEQGEASSASASPTKQKDRAKKLPSQHSLRTMRLAHESPSEHGVSMTGSSAASPILAKSISTAGEDEDDEDWGRRGRTRSKRGLVWIESNNTASASTPAAAANQRGKLSEIFPAQVPKEEDERDARSDAKVDNALRLNLSSAETGRKMVEDLKKKMAEKGPIAQAWNDAS